MLPPPRDASYCLQTGTVIENPAGEKDKATASLVQMVWGQLPCSSPQWVSVLILTSCSLSSALNIRVNFANIKPEQLPLFRPDLDSQWTLSLSLTLKVSWSGLI